MGESDLGDLLKDVRRHVEWQRADGTTRELNKSRARAQGAPPASEAKPKTQVAKGPVRSIFDLPKVEAVPEAERQTLDEVRAELGDCTRCKLCKGRTNLVFGVGNPKAQLVFVGEGPGADEDAQGIPFVGKAGQLLTKMIEAMGFSRDEVYICNVVKCRPPGNRNPELDEIQACEPFLRKQLGAIQPKVIVALGKFAAQTLLRDETPITRMRGHWRNYCGIELMPTFHPAYLLRNPPEKKNAWADLQQVMKVFGKETPEVMNGSVEVHEIPAPSLEGNPLGDPTRRKTPVYLPPGYGQSRARFPVVYFLHGYSGSGMGWLNTTGFSPTPIERLDALVSARTVPPVVAVYCDGWTGIGGTQWINSEAVGRYGDYLFRDVVGYVDRTFRTAPQAPARALIGKSSGGYGVMATARDRPDVFAHVACHSGDAYFEYCYLVDFPKAASALRRAGGVEAWFRELTDRARATKTRGDDFSVINILAMAAAYSPKKGQSLGIELPFELETGRIKPDVWGRWLEQDPVRFIPQRVDAFRKLKSLFIDCGTRDEFNLQWGARMMVEELRQAKVDVVHEEFDDGHMGIYYRYDRSLSYLLPRLTL